MSSSPPPSPLPVSLSEIREFIVIIVLGSIVLVPSSQKAAGESSGDKKKKLGYKSKNK
jgi:hypothetical protein